MTPDPSGLSEQLARALNDLYVLRQFPGGPRDFWPRMLTCAANLVAADHLLILMRDTAQPGRWKKIGEWSANRGPSRFVVAFTTQLEDLANRCLNTGNLIDSLDSATEAAPGQYALAVRLKLNRTEDEVVLATLLSNVTAAAAREALIRLNLAADTPQLYQLNQATRQATADVEKFAAAIDVMAPLNAEKTFMGAALVFCNAMASRFNCERASLGWLEGGYIRLRAISRTEKFDRQMAAAQALEAAMEECLDQDEEVICPEPEGSSTVTRDHAKFMKEQGTDHLCSLPLRMDGKVAAVLTCERQAAPFTAMEAQQLRLCCDQAARRLGDLKHLDRWFGARWAATAREHAATWIGPEHTWGKLLALLVVVLLAALVFVKVNYRVEGNFILRSDEASYLTAPFDSYIEKVFVRTGDVVEKGGNLVGLDTSELLLEETAALADLTRYQRDSEKARATRALADMRIAESMAEQARARLGLVRYRLQSALIRSPFSGVVVEGDLRERIAAPVKQGDPLFKVARLDTLYVEAEINERDVHEILGRTRGEIAFVSQPKQKYSATLVRVEPAAIPKKDANMFLVRLTLDGKPESWWRPGMSGLCKLGGEKRTLLWILTHRTVDFLRMKLWW